MMAHTYNPSRKLGQDDHEFKAGLGYNSETLSQKTKQTRQG
jgi:hypothetical protein